MCWDGKMYCDVFVIVCIMCKVNKNILSEKVGGI